jgi:hypothetical protein
VHRPVGRFDSEFLDLLNIIGGKHVSGGQSSLMAANPKHYVPILPNTEVTLEYLSNAIGAAVRDRVTPTLLILSHGASKYSREPMDPKISASPINFFLDTFPETYISFPELANTILQQAGSARVEVVLLTCLSGAAQLDLKTLSPRFQAQIRLLTVTAPDQPLYFNDMKNVVIPYLATNLNTPDFSLQKNGRRTA